MSETDSGLPPNDVLKDIYSSRTVVQRDGSRRRVHSEIPPALSGALYRMLLKHKPESVVEIGMCYGVSTLAMLTAINETGAGHVVSIDPYQNTDEMGIGVLNVERAGLSHLHTLIEKPSYEALPELLRQGKKIDFAYIDGWHTFDYVLVDFFYLDKLVKVGGILAFNDCGWQSVNKVLRVVQSHRKYEELDSGLPVAYEARNPLFSLAKRLQGRRSGDRYFRKLEEWEPDVGFFAQF